MLGKIKLFPVIHLVYIAFKNKVLYVHFQSQSRNLRWNANKTFLGENAPKNFLLFDLSILKWYEWVFSCAKITVVLIALLHSSLDIGNCCNDILLVSDGYIIIVSNLKQKNWTKMIGFVIFYLILSLQSTPNAVLRIYILALPLSHEIGGLL